MEGFRHKTEGHFHSTLVRVDEITDHREVIADCLLLLFRLPWLSAIEI